MFLRKTRELARIAASAEPAIRGTVVPARSTFELTAAGPASFGVDIDPGVLYGMAGLDEAISWLTGYRRVSRREAITAPSVKRARDLLAGGIGQLPLKLYGPDGKAVPWAFFDQPEERIASVITWTNTVDDLVFEGRCLFKITHTGWHGKPAVGARLDPETVTLGRENRVYRSGATSGSKLEYVPDSQVIRIDSPNDPILVAGARAIRALVRLEAAGLNAIDGVPPNDFFTPADDADPAEDEDVTFFLNQWQEARAARRTAYVPAAVKYHNNVFSPEQLQLNGAREMAIAEIARLTGIDGEDLGIPTTSRTYFNAQDRRQVRLSDTYGPYMRAIESRLSMDDVCPHGYVARFDTSEYLRPDDKTAAETDVILINAGIITKEEARAKRGLDPHAAPAATPAAATTEEIPA